MKNTKFQLNISKIVSVKPKKTTRTWCVNTTIAIKFDNSGLKGKILWLGQTLNRE